MSYPFRFVKPKPGGCQGPRFLQSRVAEVERIGTNVDKATGNKNVSCATTPFGTFYVGVEIKDVTIAPVLDPFVLKLGNTFSYSFDIFVGGHPIKSVFHTPYTGSSFCVWCIPCCNPKEVQDAVIKELKRSHSSVFAQCPGTSDYFRLVGSVTGACSVLSDIIEKVIIRFKVSGELFNAEPGKKNDEDLKNGHTQSINIPSKSKTLIYPGVPRDHMLHVGRYCAVVYKKAGSDAYSRGFTTDNDRVTGIMSTLRFFVSAPQLGFPRAYHDLIAGFETTGMAPTVLSASIPLEDLLKRPYQGINSILRADLLPYAPEAAGESGVSFFHCHAIIHVCHSIAQRAA